MNKKITVDSSSECQNASGQPPVHPFMSAFGTAQRKESEFDGETTYRMLLALSSQKTDEQVDKLLRSILHVGRRETIDPLEARLLRDLQSLAAQDVLADKPLTTSEQQRMQNMQRLLRRIRAMSRTE